MVRLFQKFKSYFKPKKIIASTLECFKMVDYGDFVLRDSYLLLQTGLDKMVRSLRGRVNNNESVNVWKYFANTRRMLQARYPATLTRVNPTSFDLILQKGIFPYEYFNSLSKLDERSLPSQKFFHSSLTEQDITTADYQHAQQVWRQFKCTDLSDYSNLYVQSDVSLLMDCMTNTRMMLYEVYALDMAHFISLPSFAMNCALKTVKQPLDLIKDEEMLKLWDDGMFGGISLVDTAQFKANNPEMDSSTINATLGPKGSRKIGENTHQLYDESQETKSIHSVDCNALYGWAMTMPLPTGDFRWEDPNIITPDLIAQYSDDDERGYLMKVHLKYPQKLHATHDSFPCAPNHMSVPMEDLSSFQQDYLRTNNMENVVQFEKLIPNLHDKKDYVLHMKNLQQYIKLGLILDGVVSVVSFKQSRWLSKYINLNTQLRQANHDDPVAVLFYKLLSNIVFGKFIEDPTKYRTIKLVQTEEEFDALVSQIEFDFAKMVDNNAAIIEMKMGASRYAVV